MPSESIGKIEPSKENSVFELSSLTEQQRTSLKRRVEEHKGMVRVFIHPIPQFEGGKILENQERVSAILSRTFFSKQAPPIILLEDMRGAENWKMVLDEFSPKIPNAIYIVPTIPDYPFPLVPGKKDPLLRDEKGWIREQDFDYVEEGVLAFIKILNDVGVKKIMVGGTSLEIIEGDLSRCMGNFIRFMKNHSKIEVKLSLGTAPLNKSEIKETNPGLVENL